MHGCQVRRGEGGASPDGDEGRGEGSCSFRGQQLSFSFQALLPFQMPDATLLLQSMYCVPPADEEEEDLIGGSGSGLAGAWGVVAGASGGGGPAVAGYTGCLMDEDVQVCKVESCISSLPSAFPTYLHACGEVAGGAALVPLAAPNTCPPPPCSSGPWLGPWAAARPH